MAEKDNKGGLGDWATIITTVSLLCGALWVNLLPEMPRPSDSSAKGDKLQLIQDADARLWQDPFAAVIRHNEAEHKKPECYQLVASETAPGTYSGLWARHDDECSKASHAGITVGNLKGLIADHLETGSNVTILGIMVNGGKYIWAGEFRRQARYAVLAGLSQSGYEPFDGQHIGHIHTPTNKENEGFPKIVPFEWMRKPMSPNNNPKEEWTLVIWLNEEALDGVYADHDQKLRSQPLKWLTCFLLQLQPAQDSDQTDPEAKGKLEFKIIGPSESSILEHMADDQSPQCQPIKPVFYSPWATIHNPNIVKDLQKADITLHRIGSDDKELAKALKTELRAFLR